jgi:hypothetical protein
LGDRLETPGADRFGFSGTFTRSNGSSPGASNADLIVELPYNVRIDDQKSNGKQTTIFDGTSTWKSNGQAGKEESDLVDSFYNDSVEHFLQWQVQGVAIRLLGYRLRMVDVLNPATALVCDVYQVAAQVQSPGRPQEQRRNYCFHSDSHLLQKVSYDLPNTSPPTKVETWYENWQRVQGQMIPGKIARYENGVQVLSFTLSTAAVGPKAQDGAFNHP